MPTTRIVILTLLTLTAFAGNSLLCRLALRDSGIDAATFTTIRMVSGAVVLGLIASARRSEKDGAGNWLSAFALIVYAAAFSFAYVSLPAATGALLLFGAVQATMMGHGLLTGERFGGLQIVGLLVAFGGLVGLLLPGLTAPPFVGSLLMLAAGIAWGVYSLRGREAGDPTKVTAGNFLRAAPIAVLVSLMLATHARLDTAGLWYAVASGGLTSGIGYAVWYTVLPELKATVASVVQLSVPVIAALGAIVFLGEPITLRYLLASAAVLGGIALVILEKRPAPSPVVVGVRP